MYRRSLVKVLSRLIALLLLAVPTLHLEAQATCTLSETARFGSASGDLTLSSIWDLEVGPDGRLYLAQDWVDEVTVLGSDGTIFPAIGRPGPGPGEFEATPKRLGWIADTLWASDRFKTQFFLRDGTFVRSVEFRTPQPEEISAFVPGTPLPDGTFLAERLLTGEPAPFFSAGSVPLLRFSADGRLVDTIVHVPQQLADFTIRSGNPGDSDYVHMKHPLAGWNGAAWLPVAVRRDGSAVLLVGHGTPDSDSPQFDLFSIAPTGDTLMRLEVPYRPQAIERTARDAMTHAAASLLAGAFAGPRSLSVSDAEGERLGLALRRASEFPDYYPPVREIVAGADGSIWLLTEAWPQAADVWQVYSASGEYRASLRIEAGRSSAVPWTPRLKVLWASEHEVWGMTLGEFDEPYLHHFVIDGCSSD